MPASPENPDLSPAQITISTGFADRIGPDGVLLWARLVQGVADEARGRTAREIGVLLQDCLDQEGLAGHPVEMERLGEMIADHPGGSIAFVDDRGRHIAGAHPNPSASAHQETEADDRPLYS
ncbi:hypothetical protein [Allobranchiibius sp. CTAmp26]|uniref:hypothetical protein n=1 Tax=Allobranchiibius sp. CTAmp26 TaxID=2815214 RepID=UPI001AA1857A|nr:hypothetical protein [Allobranchiibius sp. CTAmp26]MBO1754984.1 hypothetical protein [Allobranchiibius sp. CTAmp26]